MSSPDEDSILHPKDSTSSTGTGALPGDSNLGNMTNPSDEDISSTDARKLLLMVMLICVILVAVSAVAYSLFANQHDWSTGRACLDCHADVGTEFTNMTPIQPHKAMTCPDCHQDIGLGFDDEHAATLPECITCHPTVATNISFDTEAHKKVYTEAGVNGFNLGANEACIVCHTGLDIDAVFERPDYYNFTIDSSYSITNVETSTSTHSNTYSYTKIGRVHTYYDGPNVNCSTGGCHQDIDAARGGGVSGGHQTSTQPLNVTHLMNAPCSSCHVNSQEVLDTEYHAAKNITCAYRLNGCHDRGDTLVSANMTTMFNQINAAPGMTFQKEGDICWGCHSGYNWLDPAVGSGLRIQVWTEPSSNVNIWNSTTAAFEQVYPRAVTNCADCHDNTETNPVPFGSGKYINHLNETVANYDYSQCSSCHDLVSESWYPHEVPHNVVIDWSAYVGAGDANVGNAFCDVICHYSNFDSRVSPVDYRDASTTWMKDIYTSYTNDGLKHTTSTYIDADGVIECVDCHLNHELKPIDTDDGAFLFGGNSVQGCGDQDIGVNGCHLVNNGIVDGPAIDDRETPSSHGISISWNAAGRNDCTQVNCHDKHNYPLDPTEGHNPSPGACHPGGQSCSANSYQHNKHIAANWGIPEYNYNCSQCHFNAAGNQDGWYDTTYGTAEHMDGTLQVRFNTTAPGTVGIATWGNVLSPTYNATSNSLCATTYCHSDGNTSSFSWSVTPDWLSDNVGCGDCHAVPPTSYAHKNHTGNNMPSSNPLYDFNCSECHYVTGTSASGWFDTTYGSIQHVDGQVQVAFNTSATGVATGNGAGPAGIYNGDKTCDNVYCHSNGYDIGGAGDQYYTTPAWDYTGSPIACGDCHGVPNYFDGTDWRELGGSVTGNSPAHFIHVRNYDMSGMSGYADRNLFWVDNNPTGAQTPPFGWTDTTYDAGEAITQDLNGNRMLDYGLLNGNNNQGANPPESPDNVYAAGTADLTDFVTSDDVWWLDDGDGTWERDEDIYWEVGGGGNSANEWNPSKGDVIIYIGNDGQQIVDSTTAVNDNMADSTGQPLMYLDSDHDNTYDCWYNIGLTEYSGQDEPLILVPSNKATGANLESTDEVLDSTSLQLFWYVDTNKWYDYDCSECHYDSTAPTAGLGTYGMSKHVDANYDVAFDTTALGIASKGGTYAVQAGDAGAWSPGNNTCYGIWCHSDGYERDAGDAPVGNGLPDWSGTGIYDDGANYDFHTVRPDWTDTTRTTVNCNSCHYGADKPGDEATALDKPNTGAHRKVAQHSGANQFGWHGDNDAVLCIECHWRYDTYGTANENQWWRPYGSYEHVNGSTWIYPTGSAAAAGMFAPLSESQAYMAGGCHNTWPGGWTGGFYPGAC